MVLVFSNLIWVLLWNISWGKWRQSLLDLLEETALLTHLDALTASLHLDPTHHWEILRLREITMSYPRRWHTPLGRSTEFKHAVLLAGSGFFVLRIFSTLLSFEAFFANTFHVIWAKLIKIFPFGLSTEVQELIDFVFSEAVTFLLFFFISLGIKLSLHLSE